MTREYTNRLLEAIAEGWISRTAVKEIACLAASVCPVTAIEACLKYMSEDEVKDMIQTLSAKEIACLAASVCPVSVVPLRNAGEDQ